MDTTGQLIFFWMLDFFVWFFFGYLMTQNYPFKIKRWAGFAEGMIQAVKYRFFIAGKNLYYILKINALVVLRLPAYVYVAQLRPPLYGTKLKYECAIVFTRIVYGFVKCRFFFNEPKLCSKTEMGWLICNTFRKPETQCCRKLPEKKAKLQQHF